MKKHFNLIVVGVFALVAVLFGGRGSVHAQVSVETIGGDVSFNPIIRMLKPDIGIEYKLDGTAGTFNYVDFINMTESRTLIPTMYSVKVSDFEIYNNDIVFFCGLTYYGGNRGCIGCFRVSDLASGTGNISLFFFDDCVDFRKMDVYSRFANEIHIVAVADFKNPDDQNNIRGVYDIIFDIPLWNVTSAAYNKYGGLVDYYEDIVCTDNYVATVEQKYSGTAEYTRVHSMPTTVSGDIFSTPTCSYYSAYGFSDFIPFNRERLITRLNGDYYATVCHVTYQNSYGLGISVYMATPTGPVLTDRAFVDLGGTFNPNWEIKDFTYNQAQQKFYILHYTDGTLPDTKIISVNYALGFTSADYRFASGAVLHSLSNGMVFNSEVISGHLSTTNEPLFVQIGPAPSASCFNMNHLSIIPVTQPNTLHINGPEVDHDTFQSFSLPITISTYNMINICH